MPRDRGLFLRLNGRRLAIGAVVLALGFVLFIARADAQSSTWTGAQDSNWLNPSNWTNGWPAANTTIDTVTPHPTVLTGSTVNVGVLDVGQTGIGELTIAN